MSFLGMDRGHPLADCTFHNPSDWATKREDDRRVDKSLVLSFSSILYGNATKRDFSSSKSNRFDSIRSNCIFMKFSRSLNQRLWVIAMMISIVDEIETNFVVNETISLPIASTIEAAVAIGATEGKMKFGFLRLLFHSSHKNLVEFQSISIRSRCRLKFCPSYFSSLSICSISTKRFFAEIGRISTADNIRAVAVR